MKRFALLVLLAGCPAKHPNEQVGTGTATPPPPPPMSIDATAAIALRPALPPPGIPDGLPPIDGTPALHGETIALGEVLFFDPRLSASGQTSCASCHDPDHGWSDLRPRAATDAGQPNLRRTPAIANLLWQSARGGFAWDGRYPTLIDLIGPHLKGQLGLAPADAIARVANLAVYQAHLERQPAQLGAGDAAVAALAEYVLTRYQGNAPWDRYERGDRKAVAADVVKGYALFTGKAQCSVCHVPPLYTDGRFHALGLIRQPDEGHGKVEPTARGAFKTPTLRGAVLHPPYFHDGSAASLEAAIDWHLGGGVGQGADRSIIDPSLATLALGADERAALLAFVRALSASGPAAFQRPEIPH